MAKSVHEIAAEGLASPGFIHQLAMALLGISWELTIDNASLEQDLREAFRRVKLQGAGNFPKEDEE